MDIAKELHRLTDAQVIREIIPRHTMKVLAAALLWPWDTIRAVIYRDMRVSRKRRNDLYLTLIDLNERTMARRAAIHRLLEVRAYETRFESDVGDDPADGAARRLAGDIAGKG